MNIGRPVREVQAPAREPIWIPKPEPKERPIPVPNWPTRKPEKVPAAPEREREEYLR